MLLQRKQAKSCSKGQVDVEVGKQSCVAEAAGADQQTGPVVAAVAESMALSTEVSTSAGLGYRIQLLPTQRPANWSRCDSRTSERSMYRETYRFWLAKATSTSPSRVRRHPV